jgi:membrane fusion protein, multidrug efflux system
MNNRITLFNVMVLAAVVITIAACGGQSDKRAELDAMKVEYAALGEKIKTFEAELSKTDTTTQGKVKDVAVAEVQPELFRHFIDVQGAVDASESVDIRPIMAGKVAKVNVRVGDNVQAGQVLAEIDHNVYTQQLLGLQPQVDLAIDLYNRQKRLWDQKIGSEVQLLQAKTQKESLEKQVASLKETIEMSIIKSPISGTVDMVDIKIGELASAATPNPAFRVVNLSGMKVKAKVSESYAAKVKKGASVMLHFPDLNKDVVSTISFVERVIDPMTRSFTTEASLSSAEGDFHPNMVAVLRIIDYENPNALVLPINTVQNIGEGHIVYVAEVTGSKTIARKRNVTLGQFYDGKVEITSGLSANDKVVVAGQLDLADGMQIRF